MRQAELPDRPQLSEDAVIWFRRARRHPRIIQFDYLHLRLILRDLADAIDRAPRPIHDALDVFCGVRPYDDLLPDGAHCVGMDIDDHHRVADVITDEFLPFEDESFDFVMCIGAFHYVPDPVQGAEEIRRVLRPGGTVAVAVPLVWEYDHDILERRYTGPELAQLFEGWDHVRLIEEGGQGVAWATITARLVESAQGRVRRRRLHTMTRPLFMGVYVVVNLLGMLIDAVEHRFRRRPYVLPAYLMLTARRPGG